ncbi:MAG: dihydroneopterin aldolase [Bacteroidales bacterium]|nr:dihydroneopterin aldolase [Bacteroidales bacterium]
MRRESTVTLRGMLFAARHGCLPSEREEGNVFRADFSCRLDTSAAEKSDSLADTVDYSRIYALIAGAMEPPCNLLECVAGRAADAISAEFPGLAGFELTIAKKNPPVGGLCEWAEVTIRR